MTGVSAPMISSRKNRYVEGGIIEIIEPDPGEAGHLSPEDIDGMSKEGSGCAHNPGGLFSRRKAWPTLSQLFAKPSSISNRAIASETLPASSK